MKARRRRGIGTVIASAVMIFLMVFTIGQLYIYSIDQLDDYNRAASAANAIQSQKLNEHLAIQSVTLDCTPTCSGAATSQDILATVVISNTGGATSQVTDVWFDNADTSTNLHTMVPQSNVFVGRGLSVTLSSLDTGIPGTLSPSPKIRMSVITALGNTVSSLLLPPGVAGTTANTLASVSLIINPPNPITTNDISVVLTITNNNALGAAFTNLSPDICLVEGTKPSVDLSTVSSWNTCKTALTQCAGLSYPVTCLPVSGFSNPTPASVAFLPYGSTAVFQWIYLVNTLVADSPITVLASYQSLSTAFYPSSSLPQAASQSIVVRNPGGASGSSGGNFLNAFGSLVNYFNSFFACQPTVTACSATTTIGGTTFSAGWVVGNSLSAGTSTIFRANVTNLDKYAIQFGPNSEMSTTNTKTGKIYDFYIVQGCTNYQPYYSATTTCTPNAYPSTGYILAPGQTITIYFTATASGGTSETKMGAVGDTGQSWPLTLSFFGSKFQGAGVTLGTNTVPCAAPCTSTITLNSAMNCSLCTATFTLLVQTGWNSGTVYLCLTTSPTCTSNPSGVTATTPTTGLTVFSGVPAATFGTTSATCPGTTSASCSFVLNFSTPPPACPSPFSNVSFPPQCTSGGTTYFSNQYNTFAWGVYNSNNQLSAGGSISYSQGTTAFAVRT